MNIYFFYIMNMLWTPELTCHVFDPAELQGPKDWNHLETSEGKEGKERKT